MFASDVVVQTLRTLRVPVTLESYAELAYWTPYRKLNPEEKLDVREAVYKANLQ
jgi:hypothetical protein